MHRLLVSTCLLTSSIASADVGLGLGIGSSTGPNVQLPTSENTRFTVGAGFQLNQQLRVQADVDLNLYDLEPAWASAMPIYMGFGAFFAGRDVGSGAGVRIPVGIQADLSNAPIQIFFEVGPELFLVNFHENEMGTPQSMVSFSGLVGVRAAL